MKQRLIGVSLSLALGAMALAGSGCSGSASPLVAPLTASALRSVPQGITVSGETLVSRTYLWRNLMPTIGTPRSGLAATITVSASDGGPVPDGLRAIAIAAAQDDTVWQSTEIEERREGDNYVAIVRNGPTWAPQTTADTIIVLTDSAGNQYRLRSESAIIQAAY